MSGFSAEWLAARESADHAARATTSLLRWLLPSLPAGRPLRVLDLACGTGSNLRYLAPRLGAAQTWTLIDHDPALLATLPREFAGCRVEVRRLDLALELGSIDFSSFDLVTSSALLDLVSESWLAALVRLCRETRTAVLFALSYNGHMSFEPAIKDDGTVHELFNRHQRTDKGFGPALGPDAANTTLALLEQAGYEVRADTTDWVLDDGQRALQAALIPGCAAAAADMSPGKKNAISAWCEQRLSAIAAGPARIRVGHQDIAGCIPH